MRLSISTSLIALCAATLSAQPDTVVRTVGRPLHAGVATLQKEVSIGVADGDDHYVLGAIGDIAVASNGAFYVFDRSVPTIRMYDAAGKYVKSIGAKGRGPGEYLAGAAVAVAKNGNLLMWDPGNMRINVYSPTGDIVAHWPTLSGGSGSASGQGMMRIDTSGTALIRSSLFLREPGKPVVTKRGWIRFRPDGTLRDTLLPPPSPEAPGLSATTPDGRGNTNANVPFAPIQFSEFSPLGYFITSRSDRIALDLHLPGQPIVSIRRASTPLPLAGRERDSARTAVTDRMRKMDPMWTWNGPDIPKTRTAYLRFRVAEDGRIWVALTEGPRADANTPGGGAPVTRIGGSSNGSAPNGSGGYSCPGAGETLYDVYEPSGTYVGQVQIPARVDVMILRGDYLWGATCNEDDVPSVVRYKILWH